MFHSQPRPRIRPLALLASLCSATALHAAPLQVVSVVPQPNTAAVPATIVAITFDRAVLSASVNSQTVRVFGRWSGAVAGTLALSNGDRTITFTRARDFSAGETVLVNLSHDLQAADLEPLRAAGYAYSFTIRPGASSMTFEEIDVMSNRIDNVQTRIYGASASDLDEDGFLDLTTVNEVSADVRVFLNRGDGSGLYHDFLAPQGIGVEASPNEPADFDNDGHSDLCIAAVSSNSVWVLLGAGDGTFGSITEIPVGTFPHGIAALDVDGDGDPDIVNSNTGSNNLSLLVNDGNGQFAPPVYFEAGVHAEYGVASGDMNGDGIADVVVGARDGEQIVTQIGTGAGGFVAAGAAQSSGGRTWVVALGDVNSDSVLDAALANSTSNNGAILIGTGTGTFAAPATMVTGDHTPASDLGDLDGDGDLDWVLSSFGGGFWRIYRNDGRGGFAFHAEITAPAYPSCAVLLDFDNDRDVDLALSDEIADVVILRRNIGAPPTDAGLPAGANGIAALWNAPNPVRDATSLRFELARPGDAVIEVFDAVGRRVASTRLEGLRAGANAHRFEPRDASGRRLASGVYHYRVTSGASARSERMVLVR